MLTRIGFGPDIQGKPSSQSFTALYSASFLQDGDAWIGVRGTGVRWCSTLLGGHLIPRCKNGSRDRPPGSSCQLRCEFKDYPVVILTASIPRGTVEIAQLVENQIAE
jgi:hypothetical protein